MYVAGSYNSQRDLVNHLKAEGIFSDERVERALLAVDRGDFTSRDPYMDMPQSIGYGVTISAPHMHAYALIQLVSALKEDSHILDVGSGSGYLAACFAKMVGPNGRVVGIEHIDELVDLSKKNVRKNNAELMNSGKLTLVPGDGRLGYPSMAPYDAIHVGAAAEKLPQALVSQLAVGGLMVIPVGPQHDQHFLRIEKLSQTEIRQTKIVPVSYVPLTNREEQLKSAF